MIKNYSRPQLLIKQVLEQLETAYDPGMNALIVGPQFDLNRVTNADEFAEMQGTAVTLPTDDANVLLVPFETYTPDSEIVDDYTRLYGKDLEARLVKYGICGTAANDLDADEADVDTTGVSWSVLSTQTPDKIIARDISGQTISVKAGKNEALHTSLRGRSVSPGDIVYVTYKGELVKRQVLSVERALEDPETSTIVGSKTNPGITFSSGNPVVTSSVTGDVISTFTQTDATLVEYLKKGSRYNGEFAERITATVTTPTGKGAGNVGKCSITSASGNFKAIDVSITGQAGVSNFTISDTAGMPGLVITADKEVNGGDGLFLGDTFAVTISLGYSPLSADNFKVVGTYVYPQDDTLIFQIVKTSGDTDNPYTGTVINITDTAGRMLAQDVTLVRDGVLDQSDYVVIGNTGLSFRLQDIYDDLDQHQKGFKVGDLYSLPLVVGKTSGKHAVVKLNGIAGNTVGRTNTEDDLLIDCLEFRTAFTGFIPTHNDGVAPQWVSDSRAFIDDVSNDNFGINVFKGLKIKKHDRAAGYQWLSVSDESRYANLYAHYKAFVPAKENEDIVLADFTSTSYGSLLHPVGNPISLGKVDIENPIAFGLNLALQGAQGRGAFVARVASDDVAGYTTVLARAEKNSNIYALCPLTDDIGVQDVVAAHVNAMSTEDKKRWRRAYFGTNSPYTYPVVVKDDVTLLRPEATITYHQGGNTRVVDESGNFVDLKIRPGDLFRTSFATIDGSDSYKEYKVKEVVTNEELTLVSGPAEPTSLATGYEIHKADSVNNIIDYISDRSDHFSDRRIVNVWTDGARYSTPSDGDLIINNYYVAAEIAGLRSAVQPQQGLTNVQVGIVDAAPTMYTKYTDSNLDDIAEDGTWIITQDYDGGDIYIRHQLTTQTDKGSLYYEDSVGTNLDEISYVINDVLGNYIGVRNADSSVVREIYNDIFTLLYNRTKQVEGVEIGPQLLGFNDLTVSVDDTYRDRINVSVSLEMPLPLNTIVVTLNASASFGEVTATQTAAVSTDGVGKLLSVSDLNS